MLSGRTWEFPLLVLFGWCQALQLGALRSDITSDMKAGHCTQVEPPNPSEKRCAEEEALGPPAKQAKVAEAEAKGEKACSSGSAASLEAKSEEKKEMAQMTCEKEISAGPANTKPKQSDVDLSFVNLEGKPIKFVKRTMGEAKRLLSAEGLKEAEESGYKFSLRDKENLSKWFVQLKDLNPEGKLVADLKKNGLDPCIDLEIILPDGFPMEPPFARVLYPQLRGGYVFERGGICFEPLTKKGWVPSMTLPALAIAIKGIFDYGEVRVGGVGDKATRTVKHYTEEGARKDCYLSD